MVSMSAFHLARSKLLLAMRMPRLQVLLPVTCAPLPHRCTCRFGSFARRLHGVRLPGSPSLHFGGERRCGRLDICQINRLPRINKSLWQQVPANTYRAAGNRVREVSARSARRCMNCSNGGRGALRCTAAMLDVPAAGTGGASPGRRIRRDGSRGHPVRQAGMPSGRVVGSEFSCPGVTSAGVYSITRLRPASFAR